MEADRWCLHGAALHIRGEDFVDRQDLYHQFFQHLRDKGIKSVSHWNDDPNRTKDDVLNLIKGMINELSTVAPSA